MIQQPQWFVCDCARWGGSDSGYLCGRAWLCGSVGDTKQVVCVREERQKWVLLKSCWWQSTASKHCLPHQRLDSVRNMATVRPCMCRSRRETDVCLRMFLCTVCLLSHCKLRCHEYIYDTLSEINIESANSSLVILHEVIVLSAADSEPGGCEEVKWCEWSALVRSNISAQAVIWLHCASQVSGLWMKLLLRVTKNYVIYPPYKKEEAHIITKPPWSLKIKRKFSLTRCTGCTVKITPIQSHKISLPLLENLNE